MKCLTLTQAAETDGGERVLRTLCIVPGPGLHFGNVIQEGENTRAWVHVPGEKQLFYVTDDAETISKKLDEIS